MKIAINGTGIAGPSLAFWLERMGHTPTLIEQATELRTGGYVIDFWGVGYDVAEKMGLTQRIHQLGYALNELRLVDSHGKRIGGFSVDVFRQLTAGRYTSLARGDLAALIFEALGGRVETLFDNSISALEQHSSGVRVGFEKGPDREFDLVIGADGLHSRVRQLVFGDQSRFETALGYKVAAFEVEGYSQRDELVYVSHTLPGKQIARFAMRDGRTMILFVFRDDLPEIAGIDADEAPQAILRRVFGSAGWECGEILAAMDRCDGLYYDRVSQVRMEHWSAGRVALVGDAAACVSLLAGEGTGLAMTEAYVLAGELHASGGDYASAFAGYERRLQPFLKDKQASAVSFASSFAPRTALGLTVRNLVTKSMSVPLVAKLMLSGTLKDDIDVPDYRLP